MMSKFIIRILAIALLPLLLVSAGCSKTKTTTSNEITVWGFDDPDVMKPIIRDFQKEVSGSKINYVQKTLNTEYEVDSLNSLSAGQGPDVWAIPNTWITRHADKLVAYTPVKAGKDNLSKVDPATYFLPVALNSATVGGKLYGLTPSVDTLRIFYNSVLLDALKKQFDADNKGDKELIKKVDGLINSAPIFWDDIVTLITELRGDVPVIALGGAKNITVANDIYYALLLQNKSKIFSDDQQTAVLNLPTTKATGEEVIPAVGALDFYTSFANPASPNFTYGLDRPLDTTAFENNQVAMIVNYLSYSQTLDQRFPSLKYKMYPLPQVLSSSNQEITDFARFNLYTVPKLNRNSALSWQFVKYFSSIGAKTYNSATKTVSSANKKDVSVKVTDRQKEKPDNLQKFTAQTLPTSTRFPTKFEATINDAIFKVNAGQLTSKQALDTAADAITALLRNTGY